jgi:predicted YcjX-like family ATPase
LNVLETGTGSEQELLIAYKQTLDRLIRAYKPSIAPSTFLLNDQGSRSNGDTAGTADDRFFTGVDQASQFVPLSEKARSTWPQIAERFVKNYEHYKRQIVQPIIKALKSCHGLIVLIDVLMILAGGVGMYDDTRQVVIDLLNVLDPGGAFHKQLIRNMAGALPHQWRPGGITRIAFVAPKLDQVWPADRDHMISLLKQMVGRHARDFRNAEHAFFNCAAVQSTELFPSDDGDRWMNGIPIYDGTSIKPPGEKQKYRVHELPADWPRSWKAREFSFPEVYPLMPERKDCPPDQINLDEIFRFVTGSK